LQVLLAGTVAANQAQFVAMFVDIATDCTTSSPSNSSGTTNNTTAVSWVGSPAPDQVRDVQYLSLYNADTAGITVTVRLNDGTNTRILQKVTLATGDRLEYTRNGFTLITAGGTSGGMSNPMTTTGDVITGGSSGTPQRLAVGSTGQKLTVVSGAPAWTYTYDTWGISVSDETTAITTGTAKVTFYAPYDGAWDEVYTGVSVQSTSGVVTTNVKKNGATIFSTKPSIDATEDTSLTGTVAVLSTTTFTKGDKITIDIDAAGTGAAGLKVFFRVHY
jgi:hypothetical protein